MGTSAYVRSESGVQVESQLAQPLSYERLLRPEDGSDRFPMLWHVDPHGTTVFNGLQVRSMLGELAVLREREPDGVVRQRVDDLTYLCHLTTGRPHRFLWFIGD